ncbi:ABC transporter permease [Mangrovibrevibacter kandeliae]|uniref:ABC transporter permease n=1 Tax=Mangrovibrevibacter kandeliae TaxID=2968473 RepID=UPI002118B017|nr:MULTISPECIES: ABC transporter permease [unclassified Aurantimonas]MCQ8780685.1 ABC transporter permease [Aurantimonas sp. CSK15Z-1]MCW4113467.1 ABC transporter permease [Aurantimonas sp. MSK8Z-1]
MTGFLLRRIGLAVFVILAVTVLVAYSVRLSGDPTAMLLTGSGNITQADIDRIRAALGVDRPFVAQYLDFLGGVLHGDLGLTFFGKTSVNALIAQALPATLLLAFLSLGLSLLISIPLGIHAAVHRGSWSDQTVRLLSLVGLSFPNFWLAMMFVLIFAITLHWLPTSGFFGASSLVMPAATLGLILCAINVRLVRGAMLETLSTQYILVARSKGLAERLVLYKHALRNCLIPILTYVGLQFGDLIGGVVIVEKVFNWPGMGSLAFDAISARDYPVIQGVVLVLATLIVLVNLAVDIAYGLVDPRVRLR